MTAAESELRNTFKRNVYRVLHTLGWTQRRLAEACELDETHISRILSGSLHAPSFRTMAAIASALGVPAWELLKKTE